MEFTLNIKADQSLINALTMLFGAAATTAIGAPITPAAVIEATSAESAKKVEVTNPVTVAEKPVAETPQEQGRISMETVRKAVIDFIGDDQARRPIVASLLAEFGAASVGKLDKEHFSDFINKLKQS